MFQALRVLVAAGEPMRPVEVAKALGVYRTSRHATLRIRHALEDAEKKLRAYRLPGYPVRFAPSALALSPPDCWHCRYNRSAVARDMGSTRWHLMDAGYQSGRFGFARGVNHGMPV